MERCHTIWCRDEPTVPRAVATGWTERGSAEYRALPRSVLLEPHDRIRPALDVDRVDEADLVAVGRRDEGLGADTGAEEADALEDRALGDTGSGKDDALAGGEVVRVVDLLGVLDAHRDHALAGVVRDAARVLEVFELALEDEPGEDLAV